MKSSLDTSALKVYAIPLTALVVVGICVPLILMPGYESLQTNLKTQTERQQLVSDLTAKVAALKAINQDDTQSALDDPLEIAVPAEADAAGLLGSLEKLAQDNGVSTRVVSYVTAVPSGAEGATTETTELDPTQITAQTITASLSVVGPYDRVAAFIAQSEKSIRLTNITSVSMSLDESVASGNDVIATVHLESPYMPTPTNLGPAELALPNVDLSEASPMLKTLRDMNKITYVRVDPKTIQGKGNPF